MTDDEIMVVVQLSTLNLPDEPRKKSSAILLVAAVPKDRIALFVPLEGSVAHETHASIVQADAPVGSPVVGSVTLPVVPLNLTAVLDVSVGMRLD
jgi:hypothetical protein